MQVLYLVHDLSDPAVPKRIAMLRDGGATVTVAGFRRTQTAPALVGGCETIDLGQTYNSGFIQRIWSVLRETALLSKHRKLFTEADVVLARNLEMLAIGVRGRSLCAKPPTLVYESLDIHRLLLNSGPIGIILRTLEGWLSKRAAALITSSPAFVKEYFEARSKVRLPVLLVENKVYAPAMSDTNWPARISGPTWKIGWFGALRCNKSLHILAELAKQSNGTIEVIIRGRPALDQIPDFHTIVTNTPSLHFAGPYKNPDDLAAIYREVHFNWAIDMFEEGLNSSWLLPNRLYEGGLFDAVPIALRSVETGKYLERLGIGVTLEQPLAASLQAFFKDLSALNYQNLEKKAMEISRAQWRFDKSEIESLVAYLTALKH